MRTLFGLAVLAAATYLLMRESSSFNHAVNDVREHPVIEAIAERVTDKQEGLVSDAFDGEGITETDENQIAALERETLVLREEVDTLHAMVAALVAPEGARPSDPPLDPPQENVDSEGDSTAVGELMSDRRRALRELSERMELRALDI